LAVITRTLNGLAAITSGQLTETSKNVDLCHIGHSLQLDYVQVSANTMSKIKIGKGLYFKIKY